MHGIIGLCPCYHLKFTISTITDIFEANVASFYVGKGKLNWLRLPMPCFSAARLASLL